MKLNVLDVFGFRGSQRFSSNHKHLSVVSIDTQL